MPTYSQSLDHGCVTAPAACDEQTQSRESQIAPTVTLEQVGVSRATSEDLRHVRPTAVRQHGRPHPGCLRFQAATSLPAFVSGLVTACAASVIDSFPEPADIFATPASGHGDFATDVVPGRGDHGRALRTADGPSAGAGSSRPTLGTKSSPGPPNVDETGACWILRGSVFGPLTS